MKSLWLLGVWLLMLPSVTVLSGCGRSGVPAYVKVSGKVVDAGERPVRDLIIRFVPTENRERFETPHVPRTSGQPRVVSMKYPSGVSKKDGTFTLHMSETEGAPPGNYRVMFLGSKEQKIPSDYQNAHTSPLAVTIPTKEVTNLVLKIK